MHRQKKRRWPDEEIIELMETQPFNDFPEPSIQNRACRFSYGRPPVPTQSVRDKAPTSSSSRLDSSMHERGKGISDNEQLETIVEGDNKRMQKTLEGKQKTLEESVGVDLLSNSQ